jgi:hypothetical protein
VCAPSTEKIDSKSLAKTLRQINTVVSQEIYNAEKIKEICNLNENRSVNQSIAEAAEAAGVSLSLDTTLESTEPGRFGAFPLKRTLVVKWNGKSDEIIHFKLTSVLVEPQKRGYRNEILTENDAETASADQKDQDTKDKAQFLSISHTSILA